MDADSGIRTVAELYANDFTLAEKCYAFGTRIGRHSHESFVISFPLAGSFVESNSVSSYTCEKHGLSINPAGETHSSNFSGEESTCLVISSVSAGLTGLVGTPAYIRNVTSIGLALQLHRELLAPDALSPLMVQGLILELLAFAGREKTRDRSGQTPRWLANVKDHINDNLSEVGDLKHLAKVAGVHQTTLCRQFRRYFDKSIGEYIREIRIQRCLAEVADPHKTLADIALAAGFYDQSHFANAFKRYTGMTPSEFRLK